MRGEIFNINNKKEWKEKVIVYDYLESLKALEKMYNRRLKENKTAYYEIIE